LIRREEYEEKIGREPWSDDKKKRQLQHLGQRESDFLRLRRVRLKVDDFLTVQVIGKGGYGEVRLVQKKDSGKIFAMKTLRKSEMISKDQVRGSTLWTGLIILSPDS
jgi:protein-serine/threonine kinase